MYITRYLESTILKFHRGFKVIYLGGPRQVGKTTLLLHLANEMKMNYVSLDKISLRRLAQEDPDLFLQKYPAPLLIDEVQYAPQLFPSIKTRVDAAEKRGQYWLTGSQQFSVMKNVKESLAGRVGILSLLGFSHAEEKKTPKSKSPFWPDRYEKSVLSSTPFTFLFRTIQRGSFPVLALKNPPPLEAFYESYLQTYIDRDLREIFHVSKLSAFHTFLQLCAARTGQILNLSDLARDTGISVHAAQEWIGILEASMQIYLLRPYYQNISKRLIKAPKMYFLDTGLAAFLSKWKTAETLASGAMAGAFFETFVVSEIIKSYFFRGQSPPIYYFRDKEGHEIDILLEKENMLYPLEVKIASKAGPADFKHIEYLRRKNPRIGKGAVICFSEEIFPFDRNNIVIPAGMIS